MDQAVLVGPDIGVGADAVAALDEANLKPVVAMLAVLPEYGDWRLLLASPQLDQTNLYNAYQQVAQALHGRPGANSADFMLFTTKDPFIRELRKLYAKSRDIAGRRLGTQKIANRWIDSAYIYRVQ